MDEAEQQHKQPGSMTTNELMRAIQEHQHQIERFLEQLSLRASLQGYTEQQHDEALTLIQKVLLFLEAIPVPPERVEKQNELIAQLREELQR
jgi:ribosome maturation protein Sdo1